MTIHLLFFYQHRLDHQYPLRRSINGQFGLIVDSNNPVPKLSTQYSFVLYWLLDYNKFYTKPRGGVFSTSVFFPSPKHENPTTPIYQYAFYHIQCHISRLQSCEIFPLWPAGFAHVKHNIPLRNPAFHTHRNWVAFNLIPEQLSFPDLLPTNIAISTSPSPAFNGTNVFNSQNDLPTSPQSFEHSLCPHNNTAESPAQAFDTPGGDDRIQKTIEPKQNKNERKRKGGKFQRRGEAKRKHAPTCKNNTQTKTR